MNRKTQRFLILCLRRFTEGLKSKPQSTQQNHTGTNPRLIFRAVSTLSIVEGFNLPQYSTNRRLSMVLIWLRRIAESLFTAASGAVTITSVGYSLTPIEVVTAATMTTGLYRFATSFWMITTGRVFPCSEPTTGSKSAIQMSPRL